jgi:acetyl esterase/lipase
MRIGFFRKFFAIAALFIGSLSVAGAALAQKEQVIPVWPGVAPGSENWTQKEMESASPNGASIRNVVSPSLTVFLPDPAKATGTAIIICPGGGFVSLAWTSEGTQAAHWLNDHGVAALVLKYRLLDSGATDADFRKHMADLVTALRNPATPTTPDGVLVQMQEIRKLAVADALQALKVTRQHASEWGIAPDRIGIMGFSAGAVITTGVLTGYDAGSRPNFAASIYGNTVDPARIPSDAPPLFILCASDDPLMPPTGSANLYTVWKNSGHLAELHIYSKGGHGFGMSQRGLPIDHWIDLFGEWLAVQGLLTPSSH